jgi:hypothetical protein
MRRRVSTTSAYTCGLTPDITRAHTVDGDGEPFTP